MDLATEWQERLRPEADGYARLALENISREFPAVRLAGTLLAGQEPDERA